MNRKISVMITCVLAAAMLTGCMSKECKEAQAKLEALPGSYSESLNDELKAAREAYDNLSDSEKSKLDVNQLENLEAEKKKYDEEKKIEAEANSINNAIDALPRSFSSREKIEETLTDVEKLRGRIENYSPEVKDRLKLVKIYECLEAMGNSTQTVDDIERDVADVEKIYDDIAKELIAFSKRAGARTIDGNDVVALVKKMRTYESKFTVYGNVSKTGVENACKELEQAGTFDEVRDGLVSMMNAYGEMMQDAIKAIRENAKKELEALEKVKNEMEKWVEIF